MRKLPAVNPVSIIKPLMIAVVVASTFFAAPGSAVASVSSLNPIALSFPSPHIGYVLSLYDCKSKTCATMHDTSNSGDTWSVVGLPSQLNSGLQLASWGTFDLGYQTLNIHFADGHDGWIYGAIPTPVTAQSSNPNWQNRLWSTHDGGRTWRQIALGPLSVNAGVVQMATHGEWTYLFGGSTTTGRARIMGTRSATDDWTLKSTTSLEMPAGGTPLEATFTFAGSKGWFEAGNDRGIYPGEELSRDGSWRSWNIISPAKLDASFSPLVAVTDKILVAQYRYAGFVTLPPSSVPKGWNSGASWLFISYDAGGTFKDVHPLSKSNQVGYDNVPGLPAAPVPGTILLEQFTNAGEQLVRSANWGANWHIVLHKIITQAEFVSRSTGFVIADTSQMQTSRLQTALFRTSDAGSRWTSLPQ